MPGKIIQSMRKAKTSNPLFLLDEVDKMGSDFRGDPSSALLEVLDPEQNHTFNDHYLEVDYDLSHVMFITTANTLNIPPPLMDRMEIIRIAGYTEDEKVEIARKHLIPHATVKHGVEPKEWSIDEEALLTIIRRYTREAGVRNLERELGAIFHRLAMRVAEGAEPHMKIEAKDLHGILGPSRFEGEVAMRTSVPGVATGLAWTPAGGDILFVEAARVPGGGRLILTGQLGEVMKESAQAALTLVKARAETLGVTPDLLEGSDVHIHVPAGAIPKDGPSAGVAMYVALVSLVTGRTVRSDTAMTGEISLRGLVLPIGGVKEKVIAAARAGITTVLLPERNRKDVEDVPESARKLVRFVFVGRVEDAIAAALDDARASEAAA
jgi:ATP-dependent Lon protease